MHTPDSLYAKTPDDVHIAYQVVGRGTTDIVLLPDSGCIEAMWEDPSYAHVLERFATIGRLICLDWSGLGVSDPAPFGSRLFEDRMADLLAVLDAVGSETATIVGHGEGGRFGIVFAASYPQRTSRLVLLDDCCALHFRADGYPNGPTFEEMEATARSIPTVWGTGTYGLIMAPSRAGDERFQRWHARMERLTCSPATVGVAFGSSMTVDLRPILPAIHVPSLVIFREGGGPTRLWAGRFLADHISGAKFVLVPGSDAWFFTEAADDIVDHIEEFITGTAPVREPDRALATVLFTDIVASTARASELGDAKWSELLDRHDEVVGRELERFRGRMVKSTGDGLVATFDGPARAVRCAEAICSAVKALGIEVRAGVHTGEIEFRGDDIGGIAVHIGQRVSALAGAGEVFVSRTVTDLVAGSGLVFEHRGEHELKGVQGSWSIYRLS
jgi:class 3 adenylate cyclase/pimeloyl-ACP methyl ester carboxylesterase